MEENQDVVTVSKTTRVTDIKIVVTPRHSPYWAQRDMAEKEEYLRSWVKEFNEFLRDHRSQDVNCMDVEVETEDICSNCKERWETMFSDDEKLVCANCGFPVGVQK